MRLFDRWTGLVAAGLLTVNPWHLQTSRYGFDAALVPLFVLASVAALLWANLPIDDDEKHRPRWVPALFAGTVAGISCYGYWAIRLFLPIFLIGAVLLDFKAWWRRLKTAMVPWRFAFLR
jgi:asparagine N-glycosylation enzyme membrane subunit Stt3